MTTERPTRHIDIADIAEGDELSWWQAPNQLVAEVTRYTDGDVRLRYHDDTTDLFPAGAKVTVTA